MKFLYPVIILLLSGLNAFCQSNYREINISDDLKLLKLSENVFVHVSHHRLPGTIRRVMQRYPNVKIIIPEHGEQGGYELLEHTMHLLNN